MQKRVSTKVHTRKIDRSVAKNKMKMSGMCGVCKNDNGTRSPRATKKNRLVKEGEHRSYFSNHWKEFSK